MLEKIKTIIIQYVEVDPETIAPESRFVEDLHFNSYDFMSLLGELEETLGVTVDEQDALELRTVGDVINYAEKLTKK